MISFRSIDIDLEVYKLIESERHDFTESHNDILRRRLRLQAPAGPASPAPASSRSWTGKGVTLPHGTELRMSYNGIEFMGRIEDGSWLCDGERYSSPSAAAGGIARTKDGGRPSIDGWNYWKARLPGSQRWEPISLLRKPVVRRAR